MPNECVQDCDFVMQIEGAGAAFKTPNDFYPQISRVASGAE